MASYSSTLTINTNDPAGPRQVTLVATVLSAPLVPFFCAFNYSPLLDDGVADFGDWPIAVAAPIGGAPFVFTTDGQEVTITDIQVTGPFELISLSTPLPATISFGSLICVVGPTAVLGAHSGDITVTLSNGQTFYATMTANVIP